MKTEKDGPEGTREVSFVNGTACTICKCFECTIAILKVLINALLVIYKALQSWLPKEHWREINHIMVGFGQVLCLPRGPVCASCPVQERCPSATGITKSQKKKMLLEAMIKAEREEAFGEVEIHAVHAKTENEVDDEEVVKKEKKEADEMKVKNEVVEDDTSPYFAQDDGSVEVKEEDDSESMASSSVASGSKVSPLKDTSQLEKDSADIEDLIP